MNKSVQNILGSIGTNIRDPFFVLDVKGVILFANNKAKSFFNLLQVPGKLTDYLEDEGKEKFDDLLEKLVELNEPINVEHFDVHKKSGNNFKAQIILNLNEQGSHLLILCTIIPQSYSAAYVNKDRFEVGSGDIDTVIRNDNVKKLIEKVETLFPFTLIGKEIVHKLANQLQELFWIEDNNGVCLLANNYFAKSLGLKPFQMEGKPFDEFVPVYVKDFYRSIGEYIRHTLNSVVLEGMPFKELSELKNHEIVKLPLFDNDKNLMAIIGISQESQYSKRKTESADFSNILYKIINSFPKPAAFITTDGVFKHTSDEFRKLFTTKAVELNGLNFEEVLSESFADEVHNFLSSSENKKVLFLNEHLEFEEQGKHDYQVYLNKYYNSVNKSAGFSIVIEKIKFTDNLQQLIKSRGRMFEFLIQNNPEPIYIYDKENLKFLEVNKAALDLYGYTKDEFLQMDLTDLYTPEDIQTLLSSTGEQQPEGKYSKPFRQKRKDGSSVFVEISKISFKYDDKDAHFNIIKDVTDRLELEKKTQLFKVAFENINDLLFITDPEGIISFVNQVVIDTMGLTRNELENSSIVSFVKDDDRITVTTAVFQSHLKEPTSIKVELKSPSGTLIPVELTAAPILDFEGNVDSFTIIIRLEKPAGEEVKTKEIIKEVIVEKPAATSEQGFLESSSLSNVFHEILTPMNVILGFAQELTEGIENLSPEQKEAVDIINQNRSKLLSTMNSIIEYSEIQKQKDEWDITELDVTKVVEELDKDIYEITGSRSIEFAYGKISSSLRFETDKHKFDALLNNLIRLISRISKEGKIYFSSYPVDDDNFILMITDTFAAGSEYLATTLQKLFVENYDPKELGVSKLSAYITANLVKILNGKFVSSENEPGRYECGFVFPVKFQPPVKREEKEEQVLPEQVDEPKREEEPQAEVETHIEEEPVPYESKEDVATPSGEEEISREEPNVREDYEIEIEEEMEVSAAPEVPEEETKEQVEPVQQRESVFEGEVPLDKIQEEQPVPIEEQPPEAEPESKESLPLEETSPEPSFIYSGDKLDISNLRCLYIEDQVDSQILFKVQMKGLKVIKYAVSFEEALPLLESENFDFIVMDINLQGEYNGLDALKIIHKMPEYQDVPIIAVTAYVLPGDKEKFITAGFNDFISKPIFREKMIESLKKIFLQKA